MSWRWVPSRKLISPDDHEVAKVRVIAGPQEEMFTEEGLRTFYGSAYEITALSDRMGYRLEGPKVEAADGYDILSDGIVNGSVQISGNGQPIVMMADRQTTGGYAKIATVISTDIPLFAQLRPGQKVQFEKTTVRKAQELIREWDKMWKEHCRMLECGKSTAGCWKRTPRARSGSSACAHGRRETAESGRAVRGLPHSHIRTVGNERYKAPQSEPEAQ